MQIIRQRHARLENISTVAVTADTGCRAGWEKNFPPLLEHVWKSHRPDLFIVAGDLALNGTPSEFEASLAVMAPYPSLLAAVPGDHDRPVAAFMKYFGTARKIIDAGGIRFIGVNTAHRMFPRSEAEFIERNIRPRTVLFTHVPPEAEGWTFHSLWPRSSDRLLSIIDRHRKSILACFFGHIHGHSARERGGVPLIATGNVAESLLVADNRYAGPGTPGMIILDAASGTFTQCLLERPGGAQKSK